MAYKLVVGRWAIGNFSELDPERSHLLLIRLHDMLSLHPERVGEALELDMRRCHIVVRQKIYRITFRLVERHDEVRIILVEPLSLGERT